MLFVHWNFVSACKKVVDITCCHASIIFTITSNTCLLKKEIPHVHALSPPKRRITKCPSIHQITHRLLCTLQIFSLMTQLMPCIYPNFSLLKRSHTRYNSPRWIISCLMHFKSLLFCVWTFFLKRSIFSLQVTTIIVVVDRHQLISFRMLKCLWLSWFGEECKKRRKSIMKGKKWAMTIIRT